MKAYKNVSAHTRNGHVPQFYVFLLVLLFYSFVTLASPSSVAALASLEKFVFFLKENLKRTQKHVNAYTMTHEYM